MKGIIVKTAYDGRRWLVAKGEDGVEYFIGYSNLVNPKQYKRYAYKGNMVVFDKDESQEWRLPHGKNATLAEIIDPNKEQKRLRYIENEKARMANEEKKRLTRERQELLKARADQRREYEASNTWYEIQWFNGCGWQPYCVKGLPLKCRSIEDARAKIRELKETYGVKARGVKSIGMVITVCAK